MNDKKDTSLKGKFKEPAAVGKGSTAFLEKIYSERPDLKGQRVYHPKSGISAQTILFSDEVFKMPLQHDEEQAAALQNEYKVLQYLDDPFIPKVTHIGEKANFFGMERKKGVPLFLPTFDALTEKQKKGIARDIAGVIHRTGEALAQEDAHEIVKEVPDVDLFSKTSDCLDSSFVQEQLGDLLPVLQHVSEEGAKNTRSATHKVISHGDLNPGNMLIDPETKELSGIIDFGLMHKSDAETAFAVLQRHYPSPFVKDICHEYEKISGQEIDYTQVLRGDIITSLHAVHQMRDWEKDEHDKYLEKEKQKMYETLELLSIEEGQYSQKPTSPSRQPSGRRQTQRRSDLRL